MSDMSDQPSSRYSDLRLYLALAVICVLCVGTSYLGLKWMGHGPTPCIRELDRIKQIGLAITVFRMEHNQYPWNTPADGSASNIVFANVAKELNPTNDLLAGSLVFNKSKRDYLAFANSGKIKEINKDGKVVDRWGNEYQIHWVPKTDRVVIWSLGPDGKDDTIDDVSGTGDDNYGDDITSF